MRVGRAAATAMLTLVSVVASHCEPQYSTEPPRTYDPDPTDGGLFEGDARSDASRNDAATDAATDASSDASSDARADADASSDAASEAGTDAGGSGGTLCHAGGRRCAFVTSTVYVANLGGLAGADAQCQARANAAQLGGTYRAWLSDNTGSPSTRFTRGTSGWALPNGALLANSYADLTDGSIANLFAINEFGAAAPALTICGPATPTAWTNTDSAGLQANATASCVNWSGGGSGGSFWGLGDRTSLTWSNACAGGGAVACMTHQASLFCFEQ